MFQTIFWEKKNLIVFPDKKLKMGDFLATTFRQNVVDLGILVGKGKQRNSYQYFAMM